MNKRPLGVTIFGIANIIIGLASIVTFFIIFVLGVIFGWVTDREIIGFVDWFYSLIIYRLCWAVIYVASFYLFWSGISMLRIKSDARKLAMVSNLAIVSVIFFWVTLGIIDSFTKSERIFDYLPPWNIIIPSFLIYAILLTTYLMKPEVKKIFNDENVKLPVVEIVIIVLGLLLVPLIWSPNR